MSDFRDNKQKKYIVRLETLYSISKKLSNFSTIEESFAEILRCTSECFPLVSAVLIEHWEAKPLTAVWFSEKTSKERVSKAIQNAKSSYSYLAGASTGQSDDLNNSITPENVLIHHDKSIAFINSENSNYILIPLVIDNLPPLGALQLEASVSLDEDDLKFVNALANLVSVALDRYYKSKWERQKREQEARNHLNLLYRSQDKVEGLESERALREAFVSLLTHDLRTPLSVVLGSAQMILRKPDDREANQKSARTIVTQVNRAGQMITDLLDANRIRSGEALPLIKEKIEIQELIKNTLQELSIIHGNRFVFKNTEKIDCVVDVRGVRRIIENLCNNAVKYGSPDTPVNIELKYSSKDIFISVCNQGNVISAEDQKSLFQQFKRGESAATRKNRGWGIGLTLVKGVAEAHGGNVTVSSDTKNGTVFKVTLPRGLD